MKNLLQKVKTLLSAAPTYLTIATAVVTIVIQETAPLLPTDAQTVVARIGGTVIAVLGAAVLIVRRVTPVISSQRGLSPVSNPTPANAPPAAPGPMDGGA